MKGTFLGMVLILFQTVGDAQQLPDRVMVRAGIGYSNFLTPTQQQFENFGGQWGSHFGVSYFRPVGKRFALTAELQWSQKGAQVKYNNLLANIDLAYASIPVSIGFLHNKWHFGLGVEPSWRIYTRIGGPYLSSQASDVLARAIQRRLEINQFVQVEYRFKRFSVSNRLGIGLTKLSKVGFEIDPHQQNPDFQMGRNIYY